MSKAYPAERAATGSGAVGFNTKEHKERLSGLYRNTKIFRSSRAHGAATGRDDGVRRWGAAMGLGMGCGMQGRAPRRWRGGAMGTSRPMATVHGRRARQRDEVWGGEARGAGSSAWQCLFRKGESRYTAERVSTQQEDRISIRV